MKTQLLILLLTISTVGYSYAAKEKSSTEIAKSELKASVNKDSRKAAKQYTKDGWQTMPGRITLEKQVEQSNIAEVAVDEKGEKIYLVATHRAIGGNYSAAKNIALVRAKGELASLLKSRLKGNIMDKNSNKQITQEEITLLDEHITAILDNIDLDIAGVNNLLEIYRDLDGGKCEVMIVLSVKADLLVSQALERISQELANKTDLLIK